MSIIIERFPLCDFCHTSYCDGDKSLTVKEIRKNIKKDGWKRIKGKDMCPYCIQKYKKIKFEFDKRKEIYL